MDSPAGITVTAGYAVLGPARILTFAVAKPSAARAIAGASKSTDRGNFQKGAFHVFDSLGSRRRATSGIFDRTPAPGHVGVPASFYQAATISRPSVVYSAFCMNAA